MKKIFALIFAVSIIIAPVLASAEVSGGVSVGGKGWGVSFGLGGGAGGGSGWSLGNLGGFGLPDGSIMGIVKNLLMWLLGIFGLLGVIGFVISGVLYLTSAGDDDQIKKAKAAMKWSIIGVVVGLIGIVIIQAVDLALRGFGNF